MGEKGTQKKFITKYIHAVKGT